MQAKYAYVHSMYPYRMCSPSKYASHPNMHPIRMRIASECAPHPNMHPLRTARLRIRTSPAHRRAHRRHKVETWFFAHSFIAIMRIPCIIGRPYIAEHGIRLLAERAPFGNPKFAIQGKMFPGTEEDRPGRPVGACLEN